MQKLERYLSHVRAFNKVAIYNNFNDWNLSLQISFLKSSWNYLKIAFSNGLIHHLNLKLLKAIQVPYLR